MGARGEAPAEGQAKKWAAGTPRSVSARRVADTTGWERAGSRSATRLLPPAATRLTIAYEAVKITLLPRRLGVFEKEVARGEARRMEAGVRWMGWWARRGRRKNMGRVEG